MGNRSLARALSLPPSELSRWWLQVGAFLPRDPDVAQRLRDQQHAVPVLMVHGSSDMLVPLERRRAAQQSCGAIPGLQAPPHAACSGDA